MKALLLDFLKNKSVRGLIVLIFTAGILFFAMLTGYLSYTTGLRNIEENANRVSSLVNDDIAKMLTHYLEEPLLLEQIHSNIIANKQIDFADAAQRDKHFVEMLRLFPRVTNNYVCLANGNEYGARREDDGSFVVWDSDIARKTLDYYKYDAKLGRQGYIKSLTDYDTRLRPPYAKGIELKKPGWTDVYASATGRGLVITGIHPMYSQDHQLVGVLGSSMLLNWIDDLLKELTVTEHASIFIASRKGAYIASTLGSSGEDSLFAQAIAALKRKVQTLDAVNRKIDLQFVYHGEKMLLLAYPLADVNNLQWISIIVIPEIDLIYSMEKFIRQLEFITLLACLMGLVAGIMAARHIINPIIKVNRAAQKIAEGDFSTKIDIRRHDEIGQLVYTVNDMSTKLENQRELEKKATEKEKKMREQEMSVNKAVSSFVPYAFLYMLGKQNILEIEPGDHVEKELTILFTDIRSYTKISETMSNTELFAFINQYLDLAVDVITKNNGFIDKFIGDAIMGLFPDGSDDALRAVIELRRQLEERNQENSGAPIQIGVGIHHGSVTFGTVGTRARMDTTVIGDSVNLASRLEGATKVYGIDTLLSEAAYLKLEHPEHFHIREVDTVKVKGKSQPVKIYEVFDCDPDELKRLKVETAPLLAQALELYKQGQFFQAEKVFRQCQEICPADQLLPVYIQRCSTMQRITPGPDWKGISGI
ncbi:MAG TPA: adenylate/guanylate cyclase domain-containing protein [Negativicutes bacterium]|nr:adenylate/guanylate cyclase domain-containing protein [Negativicutes bacterium]